MRSAFAALVLLLLAVMGWAAWDDLSPEWRGVQRAMVRREIVRLSTELVTARAELDRPGTREEIARLDERARAAAAAPEEARAVALQARLDSVEAGIGELRDALRAEDLRLRQPDVARVLEEATKRFEEAEAAYAGATGRWPPDTLQLARLWAVRESAAEARRILEEPLPMLRARLDERRGEAADLRAELDGLAAPRREIERRRREILDPVETREARLARLRARPLRIRELVSADGTVVARCPTCHGTLDDPPGAHPALPAEAAFRDVPCTVCHGGHGRALSADDAHRGMLASTAQGGGPYSLRGRIDRLARAGAAEREELREELRRITGLDPAEERTGAAGPTDPDSAEAAAWSEWWRGAEAWFEADDSGAEGRDGGVRAAAGVDPWLYSARGRPLRYVGSRKCLGCHDALHREHSRRWLATKFRTLERLATVADPRPCLPCHTTGFDPVHGTYAEPGVTCEGCHGPGERYDEMMTVGQELVARGEEVRGREILAHSARLAREAISRRLVPEDTGPNNVCVTCHHPRQHRAGCPGILDRDAARAAATAGRP